MSWTNTQKTSASQFLLKEDGDSLLLETGDQILLEEFVGTTWTNVTKN